MRGLASEDIVAKRSVGEYHRQNNGSADEQERLGCSRGGCLPKGNFEWNQPWPEADAQADIAGEKDPYAREKGTILPTLMQISPYQNKKAYSQNRYGQEIEEGGET